MTDTVILFEDEGYRLFLPLVYSRPVFELRCGVFTLRERVAALLGQPPAAICRPHLATRLWRRALAAGPAERDARR